MYRRRRRRSHHRQYLRQRSTEREHDVTHFHFCFARLRKLKEDERRQPNVLFCNNIIIFKVVCTRARTDEYVYLRYTHIERERESGIGVDI